MIKSYLFCCKNINWFSLNLDNRSERRGSRYIYKKLYSGIYLEQNDK
jgi:hypothetical protein